MLWSSMHSHMLRYPLMKNWSLVTESKNLLPLITMGFNASTELVAHASSMMVAEIFILSVGCVDWKSKKSVKRKRKRKRCYQEML